VSIESIIDSLSQLPLGVLYLIIGAISAIENIFPPFPADVKDEQRSFTIEFNLKAKRSAA